MTYHISELDSRLVYQEGHSYPYCSADDEEAAQRIVQALNLFAFVESSEVDGVLTKRLLWAEEAERVLVRVLDSLEQTASSLLNKEQTSTGVWRTIYILKKFGIMNDLHEQPTPAPAVQENG
jgi:hypothetical protein